MYKLIEMDGLRFVKNLVSFMMIVQQRILSVYFFVVDYKTKHGQHSFLNRVYRLFGQYVHRLVVVVE